MLSRLLMMLCFVGCVFVVCFPALAQDAELPVIAWTECPFEIPDGEAEGQTLDCGTLITYEDHFSDEDDAQVALAFVILYSNNEPLPDPVIYLEGGPGGSALSSVEGWAQSSVRTDNDVILLDQRGTGYSLPSLNCIETEGDDYDDAMEAQQACYDRFVDEGININAYNSAQSAADVAELMGLLQEELNYSEYNLLGISYGTRLALTILRDTPDGIRSVIIDSVYPPVVNAYEKQAINQYRGLRMLFDGCFADPDCDNTYPDLEAVFYDTYVSLDESPGVYETEDPDTGEVSEEELSGGSFLDLIVQALYSTSAIPELPLVIYEVAEGNYGIVSLIDSGEIEDGNYSRSGALRQDDLGDISDSEGMFNAVECHEELPFNDLDAAIEASADIPDPIHDTLVEGVESQFAICEMYGLDSADDVETEAIYSDVPTLVLAGDYDPITPPEDAQIAAETLSNSYYFEFPGHGHGITDSDECAQIVIAQFIAEPTAEPDGSCIDEYEGPVFILR